MCRQLPVKLVVGDVVVVVVVDEAVVGLNVVVVAGVVVSVTGIGSIVASEHVAKFSHIMSTTR